MAALVAAGLPNDAKIPISASRQHAMDVIGVITQDGTWDEQGNVITPPHDLPGWHVNFIGVPPEGWADYEVRPKNPYRVWLGETA